MNRTVKLVETHADHRKGPSDDLVAACREGYVPSLSWLVTKEDGSQAIVVLLYSDKMNVKLDTGKMNVKLDTGPYLDAVAKMELDERRIAPWTPADVTRLIVAATFAIGVLAVVFFVLSSRA